MVEHVEKIDSLKERAVEMLSSLIDSATQAGEFIKGQIPLVVRELLVYHTALYAFWTFVSAIAAIGAAVWIRHCLKQHKDWTDDWALAAIPGWIGGPIAIIGFCCSVTNLMQITLAPRVWLIEYAASLVK